MELAGGWLGVGGLRVEGFGAEKLCVGVVWVNSRHRNLSRAMALHVTKSTGRLLRFRAFFSVRPKFISGNPIGRGCATKPVSSCRVARLIGVRAA